MNNSHTQHSADPAMAGCSQVLMVPLSDRWQVFHRLQELEIPCTYQPEAGLRVEISSPLGALQLWSVLRQLNTSPRQLAQWLETCWQR
jgi:hypothetical protein